MASYDIQRDPLTRYEFHALCLSVHRQVVDTNGYIDSTDEERARRLFISKCFDIGMVVQKILSVVARPIFLHVEEPDEDDSLEDFA